MNIVVEDRSILKLYLLGRLKPEQQEQVEEGLLTDDAVYDALQLAEDDLIEEYVDKELSPEEAQSFESHFLITPERLQRVEFLKALSTYSRSRFAAPPVPAPRPAALPSASQRNWWPVAIAAILLVVVLGGVYFLLQPGAPRRETIATLTLQPTFKERAAGPATPRVQHGTDRILLTLQLPEDEKTGATHQAQLENQDGVIEILPADKRGDQTVAVTIPAAKLNRGLYLVRLIINEADGSSRRLNNYYRFDIE